jgi:ketosteroid isomerase-like protein
MKKIISALLLFASCTIAYSQRSIEGLIQAEKNFAAYSVQHGIKDAFLKFLDSAGLVFENAKAVNGIEAWNKRGKRPEVLNWWPQFAEISESGDFGYTSGPWVLKNGATDSVLARGQYSTVWHINRKGEWKFLIDLGVGNTPADTSTFISISKNDKPQRGSKKSLLKREEEFIQASKGIFEPLSKENEEMLRQSGDSSVVPYLTAMSAYSVLIRNGMAPQAETWRPEAFPKKARYTISGSGIAPSGDLGYVYGTVKVNGKTDNYLRIWRSTKDGWKLAFEVVRY